MFLRFSTISILFFKKIKVIFTFLLENSFLQIQLQLSSLRSIYFLTPHPLFLTKLGVIVWVVYHCTQN